jgi:hypothetical protein
LSSTEIVPMLISTRAAVIRPLAAVRHRRRHPPLDEQEPPGWLTAAALLALAALMALSVAALTL